MATRPMQRPNGRSARVRAQVHRAVLDLLAEDPADGVSVAAVADRSGVHAATIYRRWGGVPGLLEDVVEAGPARTAPLPDTGSLRGDVEAYARAVADTLAGPLGVLTLRTAAANVRPEAGPSPVLTERSAQLQLMLDRAAARGERPPSVDRLLDVVVAPLYFRALFGRPASADDAVALVDRLLADASG